VESRLQFAALSPRIYAVGDHDARLVESQNLFRTANDRLGERVQKYGSENAVPFLCECPDADCLGRVDLTLAQYAQVRANPDRFVILPGHQLTEGERIVEDGYDFQVVQRMRNGG
jgi:hypothetical protein